jgi:hypothetical protein
MTRRIRPGPSQQADVWLVTRMAFGPFIVKASFGDAIVVGPESAMAFLRSLSAEHRAADHWKAAKRMLERASADLESENLAAQAFRVALETNDLLIR